MGFTESRGSQPQKCERGSLWSVCLLPKPQRAGAGVRRFPNTLPEMWERARMEPEFLELSAILKSNLAWQENLPCWKNKFILKSPSNALAVTEH